MGALKFLSTKCERIVSYTEKHFVRFFAKTASCTCMASVLVSMGEILKNKFDRALALRVAFVVVQIQECTLFLAIVLYNNYCPA